MLLCMCFVCAASKAQQANIYIDDAVAAPGSEVILSVKINNTEGGVAGFSCKIYLPDGFEIIKVARGSRLLEKNANEEYITTFQSAKLMDGSFMLLAYGGLPISGTDGDVAKLTVSVPEKIEKGDYNVNLREIECSMGSAITSTMTETNSLLTIAERLYDKGYTICTTPITTSAGTANTIVLNFAGIDEDITDIEFDMELPSFLSRTKSGRVIKSFDSADEERMYVNGTEGDHSIAIDGNHVKIAAIVDDEFKYIAGTRGALVNMYYTTAAGATDGIYPVTLLNIIIKKGNGEILNVAPTTSYVKVGNPTGESLTLVGHVAEEVNTVLAAERALSSIDMSKVESMDGILTLVDGRDFIAPTKPVLVENVTFEAVVSSSLGYKTLVLPYNCEVPEGFEAYEVESVTNGTLGMVSVHSISANKPVILKNVGTATFNSQNVEIVSCKDELTNGVLIGTYITKKAPIGSYVLQNHDDNIAFYRVTEAVQPFVGAFRAYLLVPFNEARKAIRFDYETTGIKEITASTINNSLYYNLAGQRVSKVTKGIVINDRKKIIK